MRDCDVLPNDSFKALDKIFSNDGIWSSCSSYSFIHYVLVYLAYIHTLAYSNIHALQYSLSWKKNGQERNSSYDNSTINCSRNKSSSSLMLLVVLVLVVVMNIEVVVVAVVLVVVMIKIAVIVASVK